MYASEHASFRVVCLGGSSTYGTTVSNEDSYPRLLQTELTRDIGQGVEVINAGLGGYSTPNLIALLSLKIVHLKPQVVFFYIGFNDAWNRLLYSDFQTDYSHALKSWEMARVPFWRYSRLLDMIAAKLGHPAGRDPHIHSVCWKPMKGAPAANWERSSGEAFRGNIITLIAICKAHGIIPVFSSEATDFRNHPVENNDVWVRAVKEHREIIESVAAEQGAGYVDLAGMMSDQAEYFDDCLHMNRRGNLFFAEALASYLRDHHILPIRPEASSA